MKKHYTILFFLLGLHLFFLVNLRFTAWPEMFAFPYIKNHEYLLYKDMLHMYPPLLTLALSYFFKFFGHSLILLKAFSWLLILSTNLLIYFVTREVVDKNAALIASAFFVLTQPFLEGNTLWFEFLVAPFVLLGLFFLLKSRKAVKTKNIFLAGFFLALAFTTKQAAAVFFAIPIVYLIFKKDLKSLWRYLFGGLIVFGALFVRLLQEKQVSDFWFWVFEYPGKHWMKFPGNIEFPNSQALLTIGLILLPTIMLAAKRKLFGKNFLLVATFLLASLLLAYPRFSFFRLQPVLALSAVSAGYVWSKVKLSKEQVFFYAFFVFALVALPILGDNWGKEARFYTLKDVQLAEAITNLTNKDDKIYLQGIHSGVYEMAGRIPPKPWVDNHPWYFAAPGVAEWVLEGWGEDPPSYIFAKEPSHSEKINAFIEENYEESGSLDDNIAIWQIKN